jgi:MarR family transcriptional regulator for hemolysin
MSLCYPAAVIQRPAATPIGLRLSRTARVVSRAFDEALAAAGGSVPAWLVLLNLKIRPPATQRELAEAIGVREATLTHHLNAMETQGLVSRRRDPTNHRVQLVQLTEAGEAAFVRLRLATSGFDERLRSGFRDTEIQSLSSLLARLAANVGDVEDGRPPWAGLSDDLNTGPARPGDGANRRGRREPA